NLTWAKTLRRLLDEGRHTSRVEEIDRARRVWSHGFVADEVADFASAASYHSDGRQHRGHLARTDLAQYVARWEQPLTVTFSGVEVHKAAHWSQGPVMLQCLQLLSTFDPAEIDPSTSGGIHRIVEVVKLCLADRDAYYGDVDPRNLEFLTSRSYA